MFPSSFISLTTHPAMGRLLAFYQNIKKQRSIAKVVNKSIHEENRNKIDLDRWEDEGGVVNSADTRH